jgi:hypothetical protein
MSEIEEMEEAIEEARVAYEAARDLYIEAQDAKDDARLIYIRAKGLLDTHNELKQQEN